MFMNSCIRSYFITVLLLVICISASAQKKSSNYEMGAAIGAFIYQGDLTPQRFGSFKTIRPGLMLHGTRIINNSLAARVNLSFASLRGDDAKYESPAFRRQRNFNFSTPLIEVSPQLVWSPSGWKESGPRISPYFFAGVGLTYLSVRRDWSNFNTSHFGLEENLPARIAEDMQKRTPRLLPVIPAGAGVRYAITPSLVMNGEVNVRRTLSDYIDGFSIAANPRYRDHYYSVSVGLIYRFGKRNAWDCPPVRN
jgi:Domain of unknown function (DUF6089)